MYYICRNRRIEFTEYIYITVVSYEIPRLCILILHRCLCLLVFCLHDFYFINFMKPDFCFGSLLSNHKYNVLSSRRTSTT